MGTRYWTMPKDEQKTIRLHILERLDHLNSSAINQEELIYKIAELFGEEFGFDFFGIFLLDEEREYAFIKAGAGQGAHHIIKRGYKINLASDEIVSRAINRSAFCSLGIKGFLFSYLTSKTEADSIPTFQSIERKLFSDAPIFPLTLSILSLPLISSNDKIIGAILIEHSQFLDEQDAFSILTPIAHKVALII